MKKRALRPSQLPDAQAHRPLQDPPLASCRVDPFTPEEKESKSKGENDELEARHLRQVCNFRWPDLCSFRWPLTGECPRLPDERAPWGQVEPLGGGG